MTLLRRWWIRWRDVSEVSAPTPNSPQEAIDRALAEAERLSRVLEAQISAMRRDVAHASSTRRLALVSTAVADVERHLEGARVDAERLAKQVGAERDTAAEWGRRAMAAARSGDDDLATEALRRQCEHELSVEELVGQQRVADATAQAFEEALRLLTTHLKQSR